MTARLRLVTALLFASLALAFLALAPSAGAAPYPPNLAFRPSFTSATVGVDGSILVNLEQESEDSSERDATVSRYSADGRLDPSFRSGRGAGVVEAVDSKGDTYRRSNEGGIERLGPGGGIEGTFPAPKVEDPGSGIYEARVEAILPLASGKVAVAVSVVRRKTELPSHEESTSTEVEIARYDESGALDAGFGSGGIVGLKESLGVEGEELVGLTVGPGEDLLGAVNQDEWTGEAATEPTGGSGARVVALGRTGALDPEFGAGGVFDSVDPIAAGRA